jgi:hypothetical protein
MSEQQLQTTSTTSPKFFSRMAFIYANLLALLIFFAGLIWFGYQQLLLRSPQTQAYPTTPQRPARALSFQGRLIDTASNPITTTTAVRFYLFNTGPSIVGGTQLWDSGSCNITPDQDGIFSVSLGSDCGTEIPANVFSENLSVWLEVHVGAETLSPRQRILTSAYSLNTETIQGYPISATGAATLNTVLVMDNAGDVVLGETSPGLRSISGTFAIEGQALLLQTTSGSNGDITMSPDGTGGVNITSNLSVTGTTALRGYLAAPGATFSATYAGGTALIARGGPAGTANILALQNSGGSNLLTVDSSGNISSLGGIAHSVGNSGGNLTFNSNGTLELVDNTNITGTLYSTGAISSDSTITGTIVNGGTVKGTSGINTGGGAGTQRIDGSGNLTNIGTTQFNSITYSWPGSQASGYILQTNGSGVLSWSDPASLAGSSTFWTQDNGSIFAKNSTVDLLVGGQSTASAKFGFLNVNSGTPTASISANSGGIATYLTGDGTLATTNRQSLIFGNSSAYNTSGNILLNPNGTGRVGIGTTAPLQMLEVKNGNIQINSDSGTAGNFNLYKNGSAVARFGTDAPNSTAQISTFGSVDLFISPASGRDVVIYGGGGVTELMRVDTSSGNIGIGATTPSQKLQISGGTIQMDNAQYLRWFNSSAASGRILGVDGGNTMIFGDLNGVFDSIAFRTGSNATRMSISNAGNVGIGTTAPGALLDVAGDIFAPTATFSANYAGGKALIAKGGPSGTANIFSVQNNSSTDLAFFNSAGDLTLNGQNDLRLADSDSTNYISLQAPAVVGSNLTYTLPGTVTNGYVLQTDGSGTLSWADPTSLAGAATYWTQANGSIFAKNSTVDLLVGGQSTESAKFGFLNVNSGTPTATIAGSVTGYGLSLNGDGIISTTLNRSLALNPNGGNVGIGIASPDGPLVISEGVTNVRTKIDDNAIYFSRSADGLYTSSISNAGAATTSLTYNAYDNHIFTNIAGTQGLAIWRDAAAGNINRVRVGSSLPIINSSIFSVNGNASIGSSYINTNAPTNGLIVEGNVGIGTTTPGDKLTVLDGNIRLQRSDTTPTQIGSYWGGAASYGTRLISNLGSTTSYPNGYGVLLGTIYSSPLTSGSYSQVQVYDNFNPTSGTAVSNALSIIPTINQTGGANGISRGLYINPTLTAAADWRGIEIANNSGFGLYQSGANATNYFAGNVGIGTTNPSQSLVVSRSSGHNKLTVINTSTSQANLTLSSNSIAWQTFVQSAIGNKLNFWSDTLGATVMSLDSTGRVGIGTTAPGSKLDVAGDLFAPTATFSANYAGGKALIAKGGPSGTANIFSVQNSSATDLATFDSSGNLTLNGQNDLRLADSESTNYVALQAPAVVGSNLTFTLPDVYGTSGYVLSTDGTGTLSWVDNGAGGSGSAWTIANGSLYPINETLDLLVGGTATATAKAGFLNINSGTPTASVSAGTTGGAYLTANGLLATTAQQSLRIGNSTTGNIEFFSTDTTLDSGGNLTLNGDLVVNGQDIMSPGALNLNSTGSMFLDSSSDIFLDAAGSDIVFRENGVAFATFTENSTDLTLNVSGGQLVLADTDVLNIGGITGTAYTAISDSGTATYASSDDDLYIEDILEIGGSLYLAGKEIAANSLWQNTNNVFHPGYEYAGISDLVLGSTSTASAKFSVTNIAAGTPVASLSAGINGGLYIAANGLIQTTANQKLTIGGNTTGDISLLPRGGAGYVAIGTSSALTKLTIHELSTGNKAGLFSTDQMLLSQLDGGAYFGQVGIKENQLGLNNYGLNWTARDSSRGWYGIAMSSDGKYQTATSCCTGFIYTSSDYGVTWTARDSSRNWYYVSMSADGKFQTAAVPGGQLYTSSNYGVTWTPRDSNRNWYSIAMSADGKIQTATVNSGSIYTSYDYGVTWTPRDSSRNWYGVDMSSDGKIQTAVVSSGYIYTSTDYGVTWAQRDSFRDWYDVAMSADGKIQTAGVTTGLIYISSDYGATWASKVSSQNWYDIAMSADGRIQAAANAGGQIYISTDYGANWAGQGASRTWYGIAMSSDGKIITAVANPGFIYTSRADSFIEGNIGIGTSAPLGALDVRGNLGTTPVASLSGQTSFAAFVVDNRGLGDIFTASSSGLNRFVVKQSGNVGIGTTLPGAKLTIAGDLFAPSATFSANYAGGKALIAKGGPSGTANIFSIQNNSSTDLAFFDSSGNLTLNTQNDLRLADSDSTNWVAFQAPAVVGTNLTYTLPGTVTNGYVLQTDASGVLTWVDPTTLGGANSFWGQTNGALSPFNSTVDLLVGGQSTASAKFAFLNVNGGTPTASIAGSVAEASLYLTGDGTITTTLNRSLSLNPNGGNVGIGTSSPTAKLTVSTNTSNLPVPNAPGGAVAQFANVDSSNSRLLVDSFGAVSVLDLRRANTSAAAPSALLSGNVIGQITWFGYGATSYSSTSRTGILSAAAENWTDTAQGTNLYFTTTPTGTTTSATRMHIDANGNIGIGSITPPAKLTVSGASTGQALIQLNETGDQDILVASTSGTTRFRVANDGYVYGNRFSDQQNSAYFYDGAATDTSLTAFGKIGFGTPTPEHQLHVTAEIKGKALSVFNETGDQSILVASSSGTRVFELGHDGDVIIGNAAKDDVDLTLYGDVFQQGGTNLRAISGIVDTFIYDTTADSDKGAWTNSPTSQNLSWYTETKDDGINDACSVSSDDRCGKSAFPKKAIIAITSTAWYVFDAQDNSMWIKGNLGVSWKDTTGGKSIAAKNGAIYIATNNGAGGGTVRILDFKNDFDSFIYTAGRNYANASTTIASRNTGAGSSTTLPGPILSDISVNDIHATVIAGKTYLAAANDSGLDVINITDGRTISYSDVTGDDYNAVWLTSQGDLYGLNETQAQLEKWRTVHLDTTSELNGTPDKVYDQASTPALTATAPTISANAADALHVVEDSGSLPTAFNTVYVGTNLGLTRIADRGANYEADSSVKYYTTSLISEEMSGDTKLMLPLAGTAALATNTTLPAGDTDVTRFANALTTDEAASVPTKTSGVRGYGLSFDGGDYVCTGTTGTCADDADLDFAAATEFTVSAWVKHPTSAAQRTILAKGTAVNTIGYKLYMTSADALCFGVDDDTTTFPDDSACTTGYNFDDNQWHHVVGVKKGTTSLRLFVDGKELASDTSIAATGTLDNTGSLRVGIDADGTSNGWAGSIDEVLVTAEAVAAGDINAMYLAGRQSAQQRTVYVTDATSATTTTIVDSSETWTPSEFVGAVVELTGGTGSGQTRTVVGNTATTLTISPAWSATPDTTTDFAIRPAQLYGSTNTVTAISLSNPNGNAVQNLYVGTSNGSDGGGVTMLRNDGDYTTDIYQGSAGKTDEVSTAWNTTTDYDDIVSIETLGNIVNIGAVAQSWTERTERSFTQMIDELKNQVSTLTKKYDNAQHTQISGTNYGVSNQIIRKGKTTLAAASTVDGVSQTTNINFGIEFDDIPVVVTSTNIYGYDYDSCANDQTNTDAVENITRTGFSFYRYRGGGCGYAWTLTSTELNWLAVGSFTSPANTSIPYAAGADLAEWYATPDQTLQAGEVVSINKTGNISVVRSGTAYDASAIGIVATQPSIVLGPESGMTPGYKDRTASGSASVAVALAGRVPVKVSLENGVIEPGDALTTSATPGVAMKATQAGPIIGKAMERFDGTSTIVAIGTPEADFSSITQETATNSGALAEPAFADLEAGIGTIMAFVNTSYADPTKNYSPSTSGTTDAATGGTFALDSSGTLVGLGSFSPASFQSLLYPEMPLTPSAQASDSAGIASSSATVATISATPARKDILSLNLAKLTNLGTLALQEITAVRASILGKFFAQEIETPLLTAETINAEQVSTNDLTTDTLTASGSASFLSDLLVGQDAIVAGSLTVSQDASVAGQLTATSARLEQLESQVAAFQDIKAQTAEIVNATVSGTLYADTIANLDEKIAAAFKQPSLLELLTTSTKPAIQETVAAPLADLGYLSSASASGQTTGRRSLTDLNLNETDTVVTAQAAFINQYFDVNGSAYIADSLGVGSNFSVGNTLTINTNFIFADGSISYQPTAEQLATQGLTKPILKLQPTGFGSINLLAGTMIIDDSGLVTINGDLLVAGNLTVQNSLLTGLIEPSDYTNPLQVKLATRSGQVAGATTDTETKVSRFEIVNELGTPVATISAGGKASFEGGVGVGSETVSAPQETPDQATATKTSGKATIKANTNQLTISSQLITDKSLIYVTPVGSTGNQVLFVKEQTPEDSTTEEKEGKFMVGFDNATTQDVTFNWWIVN